MLLLLLMMMIVMMITMQLLLMIIMLTMLMVMMTISTDIGTHTHTYLCRLGLSFGGGLRRDSLHTTPILMTPRGQGWKRRVRVYIRCAGLRRLELPHTQTHIRDREKDIRREGRRPLNRALEKTRARMAGEKGGLYNPNNRNNPIKEGVTPIARIAPVRKEGPDLLR